MMVDDHLGTDGQVEEYMIKRGQEKRIARACRNRKGCHIILHQKNCSGGSDCCRTGRLNLNPSQRKRIMAAESHGHKKIDLSFKSGDLDRNKSVVGGFIPLIIAALASSVAGGLIERGIAGAGLVWKHSNGVCKVKLMSGGGVHITPYRGKFTPSKETGAGLYLAPWRKGRGLEPRPANSDDLKKISAPHKKILRELLRQAIHE